MEYLSRCGLLCGECPVYLATRARDMAMKERLAREYSNEHVSLTAEDITCEGCFSASADRSKICGGCDIRRCGVEKDTANCGMCGGYPCPKIEEHVPAGSPNRERLDRIHSATEAPCRTSEG